MNALTAVENTPAGQRIADYMAGREYYGNDSSPYINSFWTPAAYNSQNFAYWSREGSISEYQVNQLTYIPVMAHAILDEAYEIQRNLDHEAALQVVDWEVPLMASQPDAVETEIRAAFPGAIPDDKLRKLRALVEERNALRAAAAKPLDVNDDRLLTYWANAAAVAEQEGYCSEYDRIARAAGVPDREELLERGLMPTSTFDVQVYVDFTYTVNRRELVTYTVEARNSSDAQDVARQEYDNEQHSDTANRADVDINYDDVNTTWDYIYDVTANN